jgi:hypothetical protein
VEHHVFEIKSLLDESRKIQQLFPRKYAMKDQVVMIRGIALKDFPDGLKGEAQLVAQMENYGQALGVFGVGVVGDMAALVERGRQELELGGAVKLERAPWKLGSVQVLEEFHELLWFEQDLLIGRIPLPARQAKLLECFDGPSQGLGSIDSIIQHNSIMQYD